MKKNLVFCFSAILVAVFFVSGCSLETKKTRLALDKQGADGLTVWGKTRDAVITKLKEQYKDLGEGMITKDGFKGVLANNSGYPVTFHVIGPEIRSFAFEPAKKKKIDFGEDGSLTKYEMVKREFYLVPGHYAVYIFCEGRRVFLCNIDVNGELKDFWGKPYFWFAYVEDKK